MHYVRPVAFYYTQVNAVFHLILASLKKLLQSLLIVGLHQGKQVLRRKRFFSSVFYFQFQLLTFWRIWVSRVSLLVYFQQILKDPLLAQREVDRVHLGKGDSVLGVVDRLSDILD